MVQVGDSAPYNGACGVGIVICDEAGTEIVEDEIGQFSSQGLGYTGIVRASYPGLYQFKIKLFSIGAACRVWAVRWLKLTKQYARTVTSDQVQRFRQTAGTSG